MKLQQVKHLSQQELSDIANLHFHFLDESFINNFGLKFLEISYQTIIESNDNVCFVLTDNKKIVGFLVATLDGDKFNKEVIQKNFFSLSIEILKSSLLKPHILANLILWKFSPTKSYKRNLRAYALKIKPELQFIAIDPQYQNKGWGKKMVLKLIEEFRRRGISQFRVGTKAENINSNNFYKKMGFKYTYSDNFFGDKFNYYLLPLTS